MNCLTKHANFPTTTRGCRSSAQRCPLLLTTKVGYREDRLGSCPCLHHKGRPQAQNCEGVPSARRAEGGRRCPWWQEFESRRTTWRFWKREFAPLHRAIFGVPERYAIQLGYLWQQLPRVELSRADRAPCEPRAAVRRATSGPRRTTWRRRRQCVFCFRI